MNAAHFHLVVNHFPVVASVLGMPLLLWGVARRDRGTVRTAAVLFVVAALSGAAAYWSGEGAEERIERFVASSHDLVHPHEEASEWATILMGVAGAGSLGLLVLMRGGRPAKTVWLVALLVLAALATIAMGRTAWLGGQIRHPEIFDAPEPGKTLASGTPAVRECA